MPSTPKAFISYSWDSPEHKTWVLNLATRLRADGIDVILDHWHVKPGDQLTDFMEKSIRENDFIVVVCTPRYKERSDHRKGGVGYEGDIMTAEVLTERNNRKFIPILKGSIWMQSSPSWLKGKAFIDFSNDGSFEKAYADLLSTLFDNRPAPPPIGSAGTVTTLSKRFFPDDSASGAFDLGAADPEDNHFVRFYEED